MTVAPDVPSFFPYAPRPFQRELVAHVREALEAGGHAVVESGTGTGKTVCTLAAALEVARAQGRRVVYLTRTNSQARQVMVEYRAIRARESMRRVAVALQGRAHLCPLRRQDAEMAKADSDELALMCKDRMRAAEVAASGGEPAFAPCPFHARGLAGGADAALAWVREEAPDAEALAGDVEARGLCPHVLTKRLLPEAELVVAPYVYLLQPFLRSAFLRWLGIAPGDLLVVVDEAHNLPDYARELASPSLGARTLALALAEARSFGDPTVLGTTSLSAFLRGVERVLQEVRDTYLTSDVDDALLPPEEFDVLLMSEFATSTPALDRALAGLEEYAAAVRAARRRAGKVPRSYVGAVASFLRAYRAVDLWTHAPLVERVGADVRLVAYALDPGVVTEVFGDVAGSVHVSGTLHPVEEHAASVGLPPERTRLARFPSPFPPENRLVLVDETVTTRHEEVRADPLAWGRIGERLCEVRAATDRSVAVFLPSYEVLHRLAPYVAGQRSFVEVRGASQQDLMEGVRAFKASRGGTLVSVVGGRLSEGLDFPDEELEVVVIVGLPYAKPTARLEALVRFYERCFGRGWDWAVKVPMVRKVLQAAGRLIRSPTDRGVVVLLDRRAAALREAFGSLQVSTHPARDVRTFFEARNLSYGGDALHETRNRSGSPSRRS